ncbi:hypothetical protein COCOBI_08-6040 [Coccomyxa sp. Obi]|nr:hypothetical protein COCOBI_08-6040 [Coccomyxa sp. Obi]
MLHHWMDARVIDLTIRPLNEDLPAEATRLLDSGAGAQHLVLAALRVFRGSFFSRHIAEKAIMAKGRQVSDLAQPPQFPEGPLERLCARLLPLMGRLTVLNLTIPKVPQLPPFEQLEHLELHSVAFDGVQQSLIGLHSLETLFLSCKHLEAFLPELRLEELCKLRHVRLDDVFPAELSLPHGCRLDLTGEADVMDKVIGAAWQDVLQHLHACTCTWTVTRRTQLGSLSVNTLPSFLSVAAGCIQELSLVGTMHVADQQPISFLLQLDAATFCNLKRFYLKSEGTTWIHIPAAVHLASLHIYAEILRITFQEAPMFSCVNLADVNVFHRPTADTHVEEVLFGLLDKSGCLDHAFTTPSLPSDSPQQPVAASEQGRTSAGTGVPSRCTSRQLQMYMYNGPGAHIQAGRPAYGDAFGSRFIPSGG